MLGCPRSGTTVLYHMLLSAGDFAIYRSESNVFNLLVPRFRGMRSASDRQGLMKSWLRSKLFRVSGLDENEIRPKILAECRSGGDFLRIVMEEIARQQGVRRWADCTPEHLLHIQEIKRELPNALFIHIIRDGRDVALSYVKQGWTCPFPWDRREHLGVAGLYWEWIVRKGRQQGANVGADYWEVRFEDLVTAPRETLLQLSEFVGQELDYDRIRQAGIGSVTEPNSSFSDESDRHGFNPVGRWRSKMSPDDVEDFEGLVGAYLAELGYPLASAEKRRGGLYAVRLRGTYLPMFEIKQWMKTKTPLRRFVHLGRMQIDR